MDITLILETEGKERKRIQDLKDEIERLSKLDEKLQASQEVQDSKDPEGYDKQGNPIYDALAAAEDCIKKLAAKWL